MDEKLESIVARVHAAARSAETLVEGRLRLARDVTSNWAMIDLKSSAAFRQAAGDDGAYIRAEVFTEAIRKLVGLYDPQHGPELFKTLGDACLLRSSDFRPLLEIGVVLRLLRRQWQDGSASPFDYRFSVTSGSCSIIDSSNGPDYLGTPLDRLARISSYKPPNDEPVMIIESAVRQSVAIKTEARFPFVSFGPDVLLPRAMSKPGEAPVYMCEVRMDDHSASEFRDFFAEMRSTFTTSLTS